VLPEAVQQWAQWEQHFVHPLRLFVVLVAQWAVTVLLLWPEHYAGQDLILAVVVDKSEVVILKMLTHLATGVATLVNWSAIQFEQQYMEGLGWSLLLFGQLTQLVHDQCQRCRVEEFE
jgi:hypothetical protein